MKRLVISEFDETGTKWCSSPNHKEVKTGFFGEKNLPIAAKEEQDPSINFHSDNKLRRDKFYDFLRRATINGEPRINMDELNKNLTIKIDELPDSSKISLIFEDLDSKSSLASRGKKNWSEQEITFFVWLVMHYCYLTKVNYIDMDDKEWDKIAEVFPGRSSEQCKLRWQSLLKMNLSKAPWTQEEDDILVQVINDKGPKKWKEIAIELNRRLGNLKVFRQGKQCRERWINHLDPTINRGAWTAEEDIKLLEAHLQIGKRWAEIAKILKNRTENAVKNRWNSLIKKYKNDFSVDTDMMSTASNQSSSNVNELEKKISELIIFQKKKMSSNELGSPDTYSQGQMQEVPEEAEEESAGYSSDASGENSSIKNEAQLAESQGKKMEEQKDMQGDKRNMIKHQKKRPNLPIDVNKHKTALMDMITQDQNQRFQHQEKKEMAAPLFPQSNKSLQENLGLHNFMQGANLFGLNNNSGFVPGLIQGPQESMNGMNSANTLSILNQLNGVNQFSSLANDMLQLNLWKASPPSFQGINNLLGQNLQQGDLASNILGMYTGNTRPFQQNSSSFSSILSGSQNYIPEQSHAVATSLDNLTMTKNDSKRQHDNNKMVTEDKESSIHKFIERSIDQLILPENPSNSLKHAIVDTEAGQIYFLSPVNKDTLVLAQSRIPSTNYNSLEMFSNSPAIGSRTWASPTMNGNLFNNPLNQLASLGLGRNPISPNLGLLQDSPGIDRVFFNQNFNNERRSNEWTPENTSKTPLSMLNNRSRTISQVDKDKGLIAPGNSATMFSKRMNAPDKTKNNNFSTTDASKVFDSPSSFLESGQRGLGFKAADPTKVPVRQLICNQQIKY